MIKIYKYLILVIIVLETAGSLNNNVKIQNHMIGNISSGNQNQETVLNENNNIYSIIVNQYANVIDNYDAWDSIGKDVNINLLSNLRKYNQYKIYYALQDINNNGTPELFIGASNGNDSPRIYDIYVSDNVKIINPFKELGYEFGYRNHLYIYADGVFEVDWSNSGMNNGMNFYKISAEGYDLELIECISLNKAPNESIKYYNDEVGIAEISQEEFHSKLYYFRSKDKAELSWIEICR